MFITKRGRSSKSAPKCNKRQREAATLIPKSSQNTRPMISVPPPAPPIPIPGGPPCAAAFAVAHRQRKHDKEASVAGSASRSHTPTMQTCKNLCAGRAGQDARAPPSCARRRGHRTHSQRQSGRSIPAPCKHSTATQGAGKASLSPLLPRPASPHREPVANHVPTSRISHLSLALHSPSALAAPHRVLGDGGEPRARGGVTECAASQRTSTPAPRAQRRRPLPAPPRARGVAKRGGAAPGVSQCEL